MIGRRDLIVLLSGSILVAPISSPAQQAAVSVVGFLSFAPNNAFNRVNILEPFRNGLRETGFADGLGVKIVDRWADGHAEQLPDLIDEFLAMQPAIMIASQPPVALALKARTKDIPIVFSSGTDPVKIGLVASLNRPGGNLTGTWPNTTGLDGKRLEILHAAFPKLDTIGVVIHPSAADQAANFAKLNDAAQKLGLRLATAAANGVDDLDDALAALAAQHAGAVLFSSDPFNGNNADRLAEAAARHAMPAMSETRPFVEAGGLMSYATDFIDNYRQVGLYAGRILGGEKPQDLPVLQATKFQFFVNLKTAKTLHVDLPPTVLALADAVIE